MHSLQKRNTQLWYYRVLDLQHQMPACNWNTPIRHLLELYILFASLPRRQEIRNLILATDMARHKEIVEELNQHVKAGFSFSDKNHLALVI